MNDSAPAYGLWPLVIINTAGIVLIVLGFLLQLPTLIALAMLPVLVVMYARLARREEREMSAAFGAEYARYAARTPAFLSRPRCRAVPTARPARPSGMIPPL